MVAHPRWAEKLAMAEVVGCVRAATLTYRPSHSRERGNPSPAEMGKGARYSACPANERPAFLSASAVQGVPVYSHCSGLYVSGGSTW